MAVVEAQALATQARPLHALPDSWRDPEVAQNMADWIEHNVPLRERPAYNYGKGVLA